MTSMVLALMAGIVVLAVCLDMKGWSNLHRSVSRVESRKNTTNHSRPALSATPAGPVEKISAAQSPVPMHGLFGLPGVK